MESTEPFQAEGAEIGGIRFRRQHSQAADSSTTATPERSSSSSPRDSDSCSPLVNTSWSVALVVDKLLGQRAEGKTSSAYRRFQHERLRMSVDAEQVFIQTFGCIISISFLL